MNLHCFSNLANFAYIVFERPATTDGAQNAFEIKSVYKTEYEAAVVCYLKNRVLDYRHNHLQPDGIAYYKKAPLMSAECVYQ